MGAGALTGGVGWLGHRKEEAGPGKERKDLETYTFWLSLILFRRTLICKGERWRKRWSSFGSGARWLGAREKPAQHRRRGWGEGGGRAATL